MEKKFDKKYSDKNTAKMIIREIKDQIKHGHIDLSFVGRWYKGRLSDGTIRILMIKDM